MNEDFRDFSRPNQQARTLLSVRAGLETARWRCLAFLWGKGVARTSAFLNWSVPPIRPWCHHVWWWVWGRNALKSCWPSVWSLHDPLPVSDLPGAFIYHSITCRIGDEYQIVSLQRSCPVFYVSFSLYNREKYQFPKYINEQYHRFFTSFHSKRR